MNYHYALIFAAVLSSASAACTDAQSASIEEGVAACGRENREPIPFMLNGTPEELVRNNFFFFIVSPFKMILSFSA